MAICGYNDKIGQGLRLLVEGMIEALEKKGATSSRQEVLQRELVELDNIISVLKTAPGEVLPEMFIGLNMLAKALFSEVQDKLSSSGSDDLASACREVGDNFVDLLARTESRSQELRSEQDGKSSVSAEARKLAQWVLAQSQLYTPEACFTRMDASDR